jgi:TolB-like protein/Tfp pilus assembly protein PilF
MTQASRAVFLSYASQDAEPARRICDSLRAAGVEVWFDQSELRGGDAWDRKIRHQIRDCALFVPIISGQTQSRHEGYFRLEWRLAEQRTHLMGRSRSFVVPICVDDTREIEADVPDSFADVQWTRLPAGHTTPAFVEHVLQLLSPAGSAAAVPARPPSLEGTPSAVRTRAPSRRRWPVLAVLAVVIVGAAFLAVDKLWLPRHGGTLFGAASGDDGIPGEATVPANSIAVLPFVDMSQAKDQQYLGDGLAEELLNLLAKIPELRVAARTSSFVFKDKPKDMPTIAKELHVAHVLEGSIRKAGNRVRITAQLIRADGGYHLWSDTYDGTLDDIFKLQDQIAGAVVQALKVKLLGSAMPQRTAPANAEAYNLYLQGRFLAELHTKDGFAQSIDCLERAVKLDQTWEPLWTELSIVYGDMAARGVMPAEQALPKSRDAARMALQLNPNSARAHVALGYLHMNDDWDWAVADREIAQALALEPGSADVLHAAGSLALVLGRRTESVKMLLAALQRDPLRASSFSNLGVGYFANGQLPEAEQAFRKSIQLRPNAAYTHNGLALVLLWRGQLKAALEEMQRETDDMWKLEGVALVYFAMHRQAESNAALAELTAKFQKDSPYVVATVYAYRGEVDAAFQWLNRALTERDATFTSIKSDPLFRKIESDPRYAALLKKAGLPL